MTSSAGTTAIVSTMPFVLRADVAPSRDAVPMMTVRLTNFATVMLAFAFLARIVSMITIAAMTSGATKGYASPHRVVPMMTAMVAATALRVGVYRL